MPLRRSAGGGRNGGSFTTNAGRQSVDGPAHHAADALLDVVLGAADQLVQRLQSGPCRPRLHSFVVVVIVVVVVVIFADFVEHCLPAQLSREIVEKRTDLERAADEDAQLTQSTHSITARDTVTF